MKTFGRSTAVLLAVHFLSSCVVPAPHKHIYREGVRGKVVDATTNQPIKNANIRVSFESHPLGSAVPANDDDFIELSTTNKGGFAIDGNSEWHWAYLIGPISYPLPYPRQWPRPSEPQRLRRLDVSASGYKPFQWDRNRSKLGHPPDRIYLDQQ
ncbi:hypothetical protein [Haloferula sp.]|uniref:hypothetical protein n=1 Tax=Haloferula sp. TaxID=2497595 RepID=UPI00329BACFB